MCTLSVITRDSGYLLAMNRDERIGRGAGNPPKVHRLHGTTAIYPSEGTGGTWISTNEHGVTLALLNWNDVVRHPLAGETRSRGQIITAVAGSSRMLGVRAVLDFLELKHTLPFRLIGVIAAEEAIGEWRWDGSRLTFHSQAWESRHWFSSSLSDEQAASERGAACRDAQGEPNAGSIRWLRRLHASHLGGGSFSLCVHREDVQTLSYTEVIVTPAGVELSHFRDRPCKVHTTKATAMDRIGLARSAVRGFSGSLLPKENNQPAGHDECSAQIHGRCWNHVEEDEVCNLEHHKQGRDVDACDGGELNRSQVERSAVQAEQDDAN